MGLINPNKLSLPRMSNSCSLRRFTVDRNGRAAEQRALNDAAGALTLQDEDNGAQHWSGQDPRTGIATQWEIGPTQQAPATRERPSRSYNAKLIRSNGAGSPEQNSGDAPTPGPSRRGTVF